jgi:predicted phosphodiesterase
VLPLAAGAAGALLAVGLLARDDARVGPATIRLSARPALVGTSQLAVPPFGAVSARTHQGPVAFRATVDNVDVRRLGRLLDDGGIAPGRTPEDRLAATLAPLERRARQVASGFLARLALLGVAGGAAGVLVFPRRTRRRLVRCALGGVLATAAMLGPTLATFDVDAFRAPRYEGALEYAPALIGDVRTGLDRLRTLRDEMALIGQNLDRAYNALGRPPALGGDTVRILHISDIHLNVTGFQLAQQLADQFRVAAVVDTGDMGTWGVPAERRVATLVGRFKVPYLFVRGNHDNAGMVAAVAANRNARVLDGSAVEVQGIRFYGVGDPSFTPGKGYDVDRFEQLKVRQSVTVARAIDAVAGRADVLLVHDGRLATYARGHVPTVLDGHLHRFGTEVVNGTRTLQTGTVGQAGPDGLRAAELPPATAEVLYFNRVTHRPLAADRITARPLESSFSVERLLLAEGDTPFVPNPLPIPPELEAPGPAEPGQVQGPDRPATSGSPPRG